MSVFDRALAFVLRWEGGYSDNPADAGGPTNQGVSLRAVVRLDLDHDGKWDFDFDADGDVDAEDIKRIPEHPELRDRFYRDGYWVPVQADELPGPIAVAAFDAAVQHGPSAAVFLLQRALVALGAYHAAPDSVLGPMTLRAIRLASAQAADFFGPRRLVRQFLICRARFYRDLVAAKPSQLQFYDGWMSRLFDLQIESLKEAA